MELDHVRLHEQILSMNIVEMVLLLHQNFVMMEIPYDEIDVVRVVRWKMDFIVHKIRYQ
jgi:uncharacterized membrane protein